MGANRIIAFKDSEKTYYLKDIRWSYDEENNEKLLLLDKTSVFSKGKLYNKGSVPSLIKNLETAGFVAVEIKPFEESRYFKVEISISTPDKTYCVIPKFELEFRVISESSKLFNKLEFTNRNTILDFENLRDYFSIFNFENKDDANLFIENNKERIFNKLKDSFQISVW